MIKLKSLLTELDGTVWIGNETYPAHTKTALQWMRQQYIPLTPKAVERVVGKKIPVRTFHITSPNHLPRMKSVLASKKSLSTFTMTNKEEKLAKGGGIQTKGGIIFYLEGHLLAQRTIDFDTVPDKQGRRWVDSFNVFGNRQDWPIIVKKAKLGWDDIERKIDDIEKAAEKLWLVDGELDYNEYKALAKKEQGPIIAKMIKDYIDLANKALRGYKKQFINNLISPPKKETIGWWNEILVYDVKIIDMFVLNRVIGDPKKNIMNHTRAEIEKIASQAKGSNPITIGTPAQYRKWFTARKGKIVSS
tara:strand:+ start:184 stop:1095 length:912 start_codon:yes stop_codon:yes gene_type:complete